MKFTSKNTENTPILNIKLKKKPKPLKSMFSPE